LLLCRMFRAWASWEKLNTRNAMVWPWTKAPGDRPAKLIAQTGTSPE
jgi:hypothetical protein